MGLPYHELSKVMAAALRRSLADVDPDGEGVYAAEHDLAMAAQELARAIDLMPEGDRPYWWKMTDVEKMRSDLHAAQEILAFREKTLETLYACIGVYHKHIERYPFDDDVKAEFGAVVDAHSRLMSEGIRD